VTKNFPPAEALVQIAALLGPAFLDAHLFTAAQSAQLETLPDGTARLRVKNRPAPPAVEGAAPLPASPVAHNHPKHHLIPADAPWLRDLGVTNDRGQPREGMADKFRQIQKFAELLQHAVADTFAAPEASSPAPAPLRILDAGSGKGYLTFAIASLLGERAHVTGIEARPELVELCNRIARTNACSNLSFTPGQIADLSADLKTRPSGAPLDVLIALHACDTATDDALAQGIAAGARLLVVSPCCQKEVRAQLTAPPVLADALRHGIFQERQAEFVTDALRAQLLEWAGYKTKVFEFISTEHTAKNLLILAQRTATRGDPADARATRLRAFAAFYGVRRHQLATHLGFAL
jgi:SAM-dependent methyltransferase